MFRGPGLMEGHGWVSSVMGIVGGESLSPDPDGAVGGVPGQLHAGLGRHAGEHQARAGVGTPPVGASKRIATHHEVSFTYVGYPLEVTARFSEHARV